MGNNTYVPAKLLWLDLEMTGLSVASDVILEVAAICTDLDFNKFGSYVSRVKHDYQKVEQLFNNNPWYTEKFPSNRDDFLRTLNDQKNSEVVEDELIHFAQENFGSEIITLAGNSIYNDRAFIKQYWPNFERLLHYRMLDVSAWKIIMQAKYGIFYDKEEVHAAENDVAASINELKFYLKHLKEL